MKPPSTTGGRLIGFLIAALLGLLGTPVDAGAQEERSVEVYRVQYRDAEELVDLARTVLAPAGVAVVDAGTNSLVLIGPPRDVEAALGVLREQDQRLRPVVLRFAVRRASDLERLNIAVDWRVGTDFWRVGTAHLPGGGRGFLLTGGWTEDANAPAFTGVLRVLEGTEATIVSRSEAVAPWGRRQRASTFDPEESGLTAVPRVLGDGRIQIELTSYGSGPADGRAPPSARTSTELVVESGSTVVVGGVATASERVASEPPWLVEEVHDREETVLLLSAEMQ